MKKFCSACGNQLELSQRFCNKCGAVNPFFVTAFTFLSDQSDELEKLRLEKERIDKELAEKEGEQAEFIRQEQLRREAEESEKLKLERLEKERVKREQLELEKMESNLKEELMRVKEETIQHQKETIDLVKEVREELIQIEEGNKRLKEEIAILSKAKLTDNFEVSHPVTEKTTTEKSSKERGMVVSLLIVLFGLTSVLAFFYFTNRHENQAMEQPVAAKQEVILQPLDEEPVVMDTAAVQDSALIKIDTVAPPQVPEAVVAPVKFEPQRVKPETENIEKPKNDFVLTESRIMRDLIGKKISGCDIIIGSSSEIEYVSNLTLIEKLASGNLKYKFTAVIVQGNDSFTAVPYIYYTPGGAFVKVDGTNCE